MKALKKLSCVLLVVLLMLSLSTTAFAAAEGGPTVSEPTENFDLTIKDTQEGHVYKAYQIFSGTLTEEEGKKDILANIKWGDGLTSDGQAALAKALGVEGEMDAAKVAEALAAKSASEVQGILEDLGKVPVNFGTSSELTLNEEKGGYTASVPTGYYMVRDEATTEGATDFAVSEYIVQVVGTTSVTPKKDVPSSEKKVKEKNDSTGVTSDWQDSADYDTGDDVPFQLKGTLPKNYDAYDEYYLVFHDQESEGLTFNPSSVHVFVGGEEITTGFEVVVPGTDGCTFDVIFKDVKEIEGAGNSSVITVEYTSKLNDKAVVGNDGNPNTMHMEYSNNPNSTQHGRTPDDKVIVFTFQIDLEKVQPGETEGKYDPLEDAQFTLEKWIANAEEEGGGHWAVVKDNVAGTGDAKNVFNFKGEDVGIYKLTESVTPPGFNTIDPIYFEVVAGYEATTGLVNSLTVNQLNEDLIGYTGKNPVKFSNEGTTLGVLSTQIVNQSGLELPETGGIGTTIFYTVGGVLVAVALILLVTKKRVRSEQ